MTPASIDHIGIGVPDLAAAKQYYDELVGIVGFREWFPADEHQFNYGPEVTLGTQILFLSSPRTQRLLTSWRRAAAFGVQRSQPGLGRAGLSVGCRTWL